MKAELKRGMTVLREEGIRTLARNTKNFLDRVEVDGDGVSISYQRGTRVDFEERFRMIDEQIDDGSGSLLDIGCAEGDFTARFAEDGLISIGVERQHHTVVNARKRHGDEDGIAFLEFDVTPSTLDRLPEADVVLLLTVFHHWVSEYDDETARGMLEVLLGKSDVVFFEVPDRRLDTDEPSDGSAVDHYRRSLSEIGDDVEVEFLGRTEYSGGDRDDLVFAIR